MKVRVIQALSPAHGSEVFRADNTLVGWLHESSKTSAAPLPCPQQPTSNPTPSRHLERRTSRPDTFNREAKTVATLHPVRLVGFLGVKPLPGLSCVGPWTPGG
jgi:hypothetical protein